MKEFDPNSLDKWEMLAGDKRALLGNKSELATLLGVRRISQKEFAKLLIKHWPRIRDIILENEKTKTGV